MSNKIDLQEVEFQVVPDVFRIRTADYGQLPIVAALLEGKTISVPENTATDKLYRFARSHGYVLRKHRQENELVLWFDTKEKIEAE